MLVDDLNSSITDNSAVPVNLEKSVRSLTGIYFVFGIGMMAWVPRLAEVKQGLGVTAAHFGFLLSLGSLGSIAATSFMGHVAHRFGSRRVIEVMGVVSYVVVALITHVKNPSVFGFTVIALSFSVISFNLGLNTQGLLLQEKTARPIMGRLHGSWALGSLTTGVIATAVAHNFSPQLHVTTAALVTGAATMVLSRGLVPVSQDHHTRLHQQDISHEETKAPPLWRTPVLTWILAVGVASGAMMDFVSSDWSAIYSTESLGIQSGLAGILFAVCTVASAIARFGMDSRVTRWGMERLVKRAVALIIIGVTFGVAASQWAATKSPALALMFACIGFFIAALGAAPMTPAFYSMANRVHGVPVSVTVGRMNLGHQISNWTLKSLVAAVVGFAGLAWAFLLPAVMALVVAMVISRIFSHHLSGHDDRKLVATTELG